MPIEAIGQPGTVNTGSSNYSSSASINAAPVSQGAVVTDLPQPQAVISVSKSESLPADNAEQAQSAAVIIGNVKPNFIKTQVVISDNESEIVFLSIDDRTGEVINKFPSTAILSSNAYDRSIASAKLTADNVNRIA